GEKGSRHGGGDEVREVQAEGVGGREQADRSPGHESAKVADDDVQQAPVASTANAPACDRACKQADDEPGQPAAGIQYAHVAVILSAGRPRPAKPDIS